MCDYRVLQMDRVYKEERNYILGMVKKIKATGCNVLLIQKSILRDATTDLSLHYLVRKLGPLSHSPSATLARGNMSSCCHNSLRLLCINITAETNTLSFVVTTGSPTYVLRNFAGHNKQT